MGERTLDDCLGAVDGLFARADAVSSPEEKQRQYEILSKQQLELESQYRAAGRIKDAAGSVWYDLRRKSMDGAIFTYRAAYQDAAKAFQIAVDQEKDLSKQLRSLRLKLDKVWH